MKTALRQRNRRIDLKLASDWAALGAEVRRRAAVMAAVHLLSEEPNEDATDAPRVIRLDKEVRA